MRYLSPDIIKVDDTQIEETLVKSEEFADLAASSLQTRTIRGYCSPEILLRFRPDENKKESIQDQEENKKASRCWSVNWRIACNCKPNPDQN